MSERHSCRKCNRVLPPDHGETSPCPYCGKSRDVVDGVLSSAVSPRQDLGVYNDGPDAQLLQLPAGRLNDGSSSTRLWSDAPEPPKPDPVVHRWGAMNNKLLSQIVESCAVPGVLHDPDYNLRLKYVSIPEWFVFDAYFLSTRLPDRIAVLRSPTLPDGYELVPGAHHDPLSHHFTFLIRHPSFPPVPEGEVPPRLGGLNWVIEHVRVVKPDAGT